MQFLRFLGLCCQFLRLVVFSQKSVSLTKSVQDWSAEVEVSLKLSELMTVLLIKVQKKIDRGHSFTLSSALAQRLNGIGTLVVDKSIFSDKLGLEDSCGRWCNTAQLIALP